MMNLKGNVSLILLIFLFTGFNVNAQEEKIKSLFIYNFARYIEWPQEYQSGPFTIVVFGNSPVFDELVNVAQGKLIGNQTIEVKRANSVDAIGKCHVIYVPPAGNRQLSNILEKKGKEPVLVISDSPGAISNSAINFIVSGGRQNYEVNTNFLQQRQLRYVTALVEMSAK